MNPAKKEPDSSDYLGRLAIRLRMLREKSGLTGEQAAEAITKAGFFVAMRTYYGWESAARQLPVIALPAIAKAFRLKSARMVLPDE